MTFGPVSAACVIPKDVRQVILESENGGQQIVFASIQKRKLSIDVDWIFEIVNRWILAFSAAARIV